jgi:hypothetical protein
MLHVPCRFGDLLERIEGARVHIACLYANDRGPLKITQNSGEISNAYPALAICGDSMDPVRSETQQPQRHPDGVMRLLVHHYLDRWSSEKAIRLDVPPGVIKHTMARGSQAGEVRHLAAGHKPEAHSRGKSGELP